MCETANPKRSAWMGAIKPHANPKWSQSLRNPHTLKGVGAFETPNPTREWVCAKTPNPKSSGARGYEPPEP